MKNIFFTICSIILAWGFVELCLMIFENILWAIDDFIQDRKLAKLRKDYLEYPVELIGENGEIYYVGYKK